MVGIVHILEKLLSRTGISWLMFDFRSIKDKSILFDNSLKEMSDQILQNQYSGEEERRRIRDEINAIKEDKSKSTTLTGW